MKVELRVLGEFAMTVDDRPIAPFRSTNLVKLLALGRPPHVLVRDRVIEALWPHLDMDAAAAALHKAASYARKATGESTAVVLRGGEVALAPDAEVIVDADVFERAAKKALASGDAASCTHAAALYGGELLPQDRYADWTNARRDELASLHVELLRKAGAWKDVVALDPLDEDAHIALMRAYASAGRRAAALRQFRTLKSVLAEQLGVTPSPAAIALHEELGRGPAVHAPIFARGAIVGRDVELARATATLRKTAEGRGHTIFVRGDAGIGKTRFCEAVLADAAKNDVTTLRGAASSGGGASYGPIVEAVDRLLGEREDLAAALEPQDRDVLARLAAGAHEPVTRQRILAALGRLFKLASKERPVVLFLDDLHDADASTLDVVHYVGELARSQRIVLLAATRPAAAPALERVRQALTAQRAATNIELSPLSKAESITLAQRHLGGSADDGALSEIAERAAGNPLFVELIAANAGQAVPEELFAVVDGVVARHPEDVVHLLERVAVLGASFTAEELLALATEGEEKTFALLDRALATRLVDENAGAYRFHHALIREALERRMPAHRKRAAHHDAARALVDVGAPAARVAKQLLDADRPAEAAPWLVQAMQDAANVSAYATALSFADLALPHVDEADRPSLLAERAELLRATGSPEAPAAFAEALAVAPDERKSAVAVGKAYAHMGLGDVFGAMQALEGVEPPADPVERARHHVIRGELDWFRGDMDAAEKAANDAKELAFANGIGVDIAEATMLSTMVAHSRGSWFDEVKADLLNRDRAAVLAGAVHDGHLCVAEMFLYGQNPYEEVVGFARELRDVAQKTGARRGHAFAACFMGAAMLLRGELEEAEKYLVEAIDVGGSIEAFGTVSMALQKRAELAIALGDRDKARALLDESLARAQGSPLCARHLLQRIYGTRVVAASDRDEAIAIVDEAEIGVVGPAETCMACCVTFSLPAAIACARAGQIERARFWLGMSEQLVDGLLKADAFRAGVDEARGAIASATNAGDARAHYLRAAETFSRIGQKIDASRCERLANPA